MRTIIPITCALCISTSSRADTPPAGAPPEPAPADAAPADAAPVKAPEPPAAASPAPAPAEAAKPAADPFAGHLTSPQQQQRSHSRIPEIAATVVTGGIVVVTALSYREWGQAQARRRAAQWDPAITVEEHAQNIADINSWRNRTWILVGSTFISAAVTTFLWMRNQDPSSFSVQPTGDGEGAAVSYGGRF